MAEIVKVIIRESTVSVTAPWPIYSYIVNPNQEGIVPEEPTKYNLAVPEDGVGPMVIWNPTEGRWMIEDNA